MLDATSLLGAWPVLTLVSMTVGVELRLDSSNDRTCRPIPEAHTIWSCGDESQEPVWNFLPTVAAPTGRSPYQAFPGFTALGFHNQRVAVQRRQVGYRTRSP